MYENVDLLPTHSEARHVDSESQAEMRESRDKVLTPRRARSERTPFGPFRWNLKLETAAAPKPPHFSSRKIAKTPQRRTAEGRKEDTSLLDRGVAEWRAR